MTTARIASLSPQVYAATLRAAKETVAARQVSHRPADAAAPSGRAGSAPDAAAAAAPGAVKPAGVGQVVDVLA